MSSERFPGKVLAPLHGEPVIARVFSRICEIVPCERVILATSDSRSDDPLSAYVTEKLGIKVFRGSLNDVVGRYQECLHNHPSEWFVRICGDSPAIDPQLLAWMIDRVSDEFDILTNVARRTFPPGQSIEIVNASTFSRLNSQELTPEEREHVTLHFYRFPDRYRVQNVFTTDESHSGLRFVVDTLEDLRALDRTLATNPALSRGFAASAQLDVGTS